MSGCCVCGATALEHPDLALARSLGHPDPKPELVTWICSRCGRLVCRHHVKTVRTDLPAPFDREIVDPTQCTAPDCEEVSC